MKTTQSIFATFDAEELNAQTAPHIQAYLNDTSGRGAMLPISVQSLDLAFNERDRLLSEGYTIATTQQMVSGSVPGPDKITYTDFAVLSRLWNDEQKDAYRANAEMTSIHGYEQVVTRTPTTVTTKELRSVPVPSIVNQGYLTFFLIKPQSELDTAIAAIRAEVEKEYVASIEAFNESVITRQTELMLAKTEKDRLAKESQERQDEIERVRMTVRQSLGDPSLVTAPEPKAKAKAVAK